MSEIALLRNEIDKKLKIALRLQELTNLFSPVNKHRWKGYGEKGTYIDFHYHDTDERIKVVSGKIEVTVGCNTIMVEEGGTIIIEKEKVHKIEFIEDSSLQITWNK